MKSKNWYMSYVLSKVIGFSYKNVLKISVVKDAWIVIYVKVYINDKLSMNA